MSKNTNKKKKYNMRDDFITIRTPADNEKGYVERSEYSGPWFRWDSEAGQAERRITWIAVITLLQAAATFVGSMATFEVNRYPSVTFCKIISVIPLVFQLMGTVRLIWQKKAMTRMDHRSLERELGIAPFVTGGVNCLIFLVQIIVLCSRKHYSSLFAALATAVSAAAAFVIGALYKKLQCRQERNTVKQGLKEINDKATGLGTGVYVPRHKS